MTSTPCKTCGHPSAAAQFVADWLSGNVNPSANQLSAATTLESERAQERVDQALVVLTSAENEWRAAQRVATATAARAKVEQKDAAKSGLPVSLQEQVQASAEKATATALAAQAEVDALAQRVKALAPDVTAAQAEAKQAAENTLTAADLSAAFEELGIEESGGNLHPTTEPTPEQADTRRRLRVTF